jgi:hypothetical protein
MTSDRVGDHTVGEVSSSVMLRMGMVAGGEGGAFAQESVCSAPCHQSHFNDFLV